VPRLFQAIIARNGEQAVQLDYRTDTVGLLGELTLASVILPLWGVLAGALICSFTFGITVNGQSWQARISDEPMGAALILWGVWKLSRLDIDRDYNWMIRGILVVAILLLAKSVADCFPPPGDPVVALLWVFVSMAALIAAMCLSLCMRWMSQEVGLRRSARNWTWTSIVCGCFCLPGAIYQCIMLLLATSDAKSVQTSSAPASAPSAGSFWDLLPVLFLLGPSLGFALSAWLMQREIARKLGRDSGVVIPLSTSLSSGE
jgi:hypothetical protein